MKVQKDILQSLYPAKFASAVLLAAWVIVLVMLAIGAGH